MQAFNQPFYALAQKQMKAFAEALPEAHVVRIPNANHYVFISNDAEVLREMRTFIAQLK